MNRNGLLPILLCLMLGVSGMPAAGEDSQPTAAERLVVFAVQDLSGAGAGRDFEQTITDAVAAEFISSGAYQVVAQADWEAAAREKSLVPRDLLEGVAAAGLARSVDAAVAVSGSFVVGPAEGDQKIAFSLQCWDAVTGELIAGLQRTSRFDLGFYISLHDWIAQLVQSLQAGVPVPTQTEAAAAPAPAPAQITFLSRDEGMEVLIGGDARAGVIANGKLIFPVGAMKDGTPLTVTKRKPGFHEDVQSVKAAPQVSLTPLAREHTSTGELTWTTSQLVGLGLALRGFSVPDWSFMYTGTYLWLQTPAVAALRGVLHDDLFFGFGGYLFFPPEAALRFSLSTGVGVIFSVFTQPGEPVYTDFYLDVASWTLETRILGPVLFVRQDFKYTLGIGENLAGRGWPVKGLPLTTIGVMFQ